MYFLRILALYDYILLLSVTFIVTSMQSHSNHCCILELIQRLIGLYTTSSDTKSYFASHLHYTRIM